MKISERISGLFS